ncbi:hypothetical protein Ahy_B10g100843 [Arachis hypogaea]|uniref:SCP domain-containing protein n=1 Tax=Arachis hypogaea TaxID=3818 RepID=A0A444WXV1_ARAHY|nr:hypothetical protein Ahy_B10g100843 [Arachis hypogaea]
MIPLIPKASADGKSKDEEDETIVNVKCHYAQAEIDNCIFSLGDCAITKVDGVDPKSRHKEKLETESLLYSRGVNWTSLRLSFPSKTQLCSSGGKCEEYIQVVWRETTHVGCANGKCPKTGCIIAKCTVTVCLYSPKGNVQGHRPF